MASTLSVLFFYLCLEAAQSQFEETCQNTEGDARSCISIYKCQSFLQLLEKYGNTPAIKQRLRKAQCGFEGDSPKVCCPKLSSSPLNAVIPTLLATTSAPFTNPNGEADDCVTVLPGPECGSGGAPFTTEKYNAHERTCRTIDGDYGSCISIYNCQPILQLLKNSGASPALAQKLRMVRCGSLGDIPKVCCPKPGFTTIIPTVTTFTTRAPTAQAATTISVRGEYDLINALPEPPACGLVDGDYNRVVGGYNATLGDFPWMAVLGYRTIGATHWNCGGSLLSPHHVLTAAHCIHGYETQLYVVRLGELDLARDDDGAFPVDALIKTHIKHEAYDANTVTNDIGILVLDKDIEFSALIRPICMPRSPELRLQTFVGNFPLVAGWGSLRFQIRGGGEQATHLQAAQLPVVTNELCAEVYRDNKAIIDERVLCAGYANGGVDACQGDSGGPLMRPFRNKLDKRIYVYQIGIVSFSRKCAEAGIPGVYTRVTEYIPWIEEKLVGVALS